MLLSSNESLSFFGNWSSILGLFFTVLVAFIGFLINNRIKEIQRNIQFHERIKSLIKQLATSKSKFPKFLDDYDNSQPLIRLEISQAEVILREIEKKLSYKDKKRIKRLLKDIQLLNIGHFIHEGQKKKGFLIFIKRLFIKPNEISETNIWNFYRDLSALQTQLENLLEDKKIKNYG
jgi:hypothetical protein